MRNISNNTHRFKNILFIKKVFIVFFFLILYRIGTFVPLPGVNFKILGNIIEYKYQGILGMFNVFTGGAISRVSIFSLNIMPFITSSILIQLFFFISKEIYGNSKFSEYSKARINQYTKYLAVLLALLQGYGISYSLELMTYKGVGLIASYSILLKLSIIITLTAGTVIVIWFGEQISQYGIGNGSSLIIVTGIISGLIPSICQLFDTLQNQYMLFYFFFIIFIVIYIIVFIETSLRKIRVQYPRRQIGNKLYVGQSSFLPMKINVCGVLPSIFANSLLLLPSTMTNVIHNKIYIIKILSEYFAHGKPLFITIHGVCVVFFCFFYAAITFNTDDIANNLRKSGGIVVGYRPGKQTADYLYFILTRITVIAAIYMFLVCSIPEFLSSQLKVPLYLSGTSILIMISVIIDTSAQIQANLTSVTYNNLMKTSNVVKKR